ncbi:MAG: hypothetical protein Q4C25_08700, partial [Bacillota bacterium]|nr:hypothetical protein [Bacillota bacterium]
MKGKRKRMLSLTAAVLMLLTMMPAAAMAESESIGNDVSPIYEVTNPDAKLDEKTGVYLDKKLSQLKDDGTGTITLETYVEGQLETISKPTDIILVLDQS